MACTKECIVHIFPSARGHMSWRKSNNSSVGRPIAAANRSAVLSKIWFPVRIFVNERGLNPVVSAISALLCQRASDIHFNSGFAIACPPSLRCPGCRSFQYNSFKCCGRISERRRWPISGMILDSWYLLAKIVLGAVPLSSFWRRKYSAYSENVCRISIGSPAQNPLLLFVGLFRSVAPSFCDQASTQAYAWSAYHYNRSHQTLRYDNLGSLPSCSWFFYTCHKHTSAYIFRPDDRSPGRFLYVFKGYALKLQHKK